MRPISRWPGSVSYSNPNTRARRPSRTRSSSHTRVTRTRARTDRSRHSRNWSTMTRPTTAASGSHWALTIAGSAMRYSSTRRRATAHGPSGTGSPGCSPGSGWHSASRRSTRIHAPRPDLDPARQPSVGELRHALEHRRPHVQLDLLAHAQVVVQKVREPVAGPCPRLDPELQQRPIVPRRELDLAGFEVALQRREAKRRRRPLDHANRAVPRPRHAYDVLVADRHRALGAEHLVEARELRRGDPVEVGGHLGDDAFGRQRRLADAGPVDPVKQRPRARLRRLELLAGPQRRRGVLRQRPLHLAAVKRRRP